MNLYGDIPRGAIVTCPDCGAWDGPRHGDSGIFIRMRCEECQAAEDEREAANA